MTKSKEITQKKLSEKQSFGFVRFLDRNYREKLFNLNDVQKDIFKQLTQKGIIPMCQRNSSPEVFGPVLPFLTFDNRKNKLSQKLVNNALDQIKNFVPPELARTSSKPMDESRKLLSSIKQKKSLENFKTHLATTGSMARLTSKPNKITNDNLSLVAEPVGNKFAKHKSQPNMLLKSPVNFAKGIGKQTEIHKKIYFINHKHDKTIRYQRKTMKENYLKALKNEDSSFGGELRESNSPFYT